MSGDGQDDVRTMDAALGAITALHRAGRLAEARAACRELVARHPGESEPHFREGLVEAEMGSLASAKEAIDRALALRDRPNYRYALGDVQQRLGDLAGAIASWRRAVAAQPDFAAAHVRLGVALQEAGELGQAVAHFVFAVQARPEDARAWNNLGLALFEQGRHPEAALAFGSAISRDPAYSLAHFNLARLHDADGEADQALAHAREACRLAPRNLEANLLAGDLFRKRRDAANALASYRDAIAGNPGNARARNALAEMLGETGAVEEGRREFEANCRDHPGDLKAALGSALLLPAVYEGRDHLARCRAQYRAGLEGLLARAGDFSWARASDALSDIRWTNFYLAYQGENDRELQSLYGDFIRRLLAFVAPEYLEARPRRARNGSRLRVGFASHFLYNCTAGRYFASWIRGLDAARFETFVYHTNPRVDDDTRAIAAATPNFRPLAGRPVHAVARQVLADGLDILVYPELGMHADTFALGSLRLAPVQCAGWGHPTTTGLPAIDRFLSCESMEPGDAQAGYRERLALLPGLGTNYARPSGESAGSREDFGLPADRHLYLVPQSVFKIHPDNDELIADVLAADPDGLVVMFAAAYPSLVAAFVARIGPVLAARGLSVERQLLVLPTMTHGQYLRVNRLCDVMLDTLHWSGGNTTIDALAMGLPVVTLPGSLMRGRQSLGMLRILGLEELVARDREDYVRIAAGLGRDATSRSELSARIAARVGALFDQQAPVDAFADFLEAAASEPAA